MTNAALPNMTVRGLLDALGDKTPTPGGGAVASITASLAAAISRMVVQFSVGKKKYAEHADLHERQLTALAEFADRALSLAEDDATAYAHLNELWKLNKDDERRQREWGDAVDAAIKAPSDVLQLSVDVLYSLAELVDTTNRMLASDLAIGAILAEAAVRSAAWNVRINLPLLTDESEVERLSQRTADLVDDAKRRAAAIEAGCVVGD